MRNLTLNGNGGFNPEEELLNVDKNRDKILSNLPSELIKKIRELVKRLNCSLFS
jgi:hypothetical protein